MVRVTISVRVMPELKEAAEKAAEADGRTLSQWVERAITAALKGHKVGA